MVLDYNGDIFQDYKLNADEAWTARQALPGLRSRQQTFRSTTQETAGFVAEHDVMSDIGADTFRILLQGDVNGMNAFSNFAVNAWNQFIGRKLSGEPGIGPVTDALFDEKLRVMIGDMLDNTETVLSNGISIDGATTPAGGINQGSGTATAVLNLEATLQQLARNGTYVAEVTEAGFGRQNSERFQLYLKDTDKLTGQDVRVVSAVTGFRAGIEFEDVRSIDTGKRDDPRLQLWAPLPSMHSGLIWNILLPPYDTLILVGNPGAPPVWSAIKFTTVEGTKTNLSKRNTTWLPNTAPAQNGRSFLRCLRVGGAPVVWNFQWFRDAAFTEPNSNVIVYEEGDGDSTLFWTTNIENGEHSNNGGHLATEDIFASAFIDDSQLQLQGATFTVTVTAHLPFAVRDKFEIAVTNDEASKLQTLANEILGVALPHSGTPTITDP